MSDKQVLEHFKEAFPPRIETQLFEVDNIDITTGKTRVLIPLSKSELLQATNSCMPVHMIEKAMTQHAEVKQRKQNQIPFMKHFSRLG